MYKNFGIAMLVLLLVIPYVHSEVWVTKESEHFIFYFEQGSKAERDIDSIINIEERNYRIITSYLNIEYKKKINCYLYPEKRFKEDFGFYGGITKNNSICLLYDDFDRGFIGAFRKGYGDGHELTHVLTSNTWGPPIPGDYINEYPPSLYFYEEEIAHYVHNIVIRNDPIVSMHIIAKAILETEDIPDDIISNLDTYISSSLNRNNYMTYFYEGIGESWVSYLIEKYGIKKFIEFYKLSCKEKSSSKALKEVYEETPEKIVKEWKSYLKNEIKEIDAEKIIEAEKKIMEDVNVDELLENRNYEELIELHNAWKYMAEVRETNILWCEEVCVRGLKFLQEGKNFYNEGDYDSALESYKKAEKSFFDISFKKYFEHTENLIRECEKINENKKMEKKDFVLYFVVIILVISIIVFIKIK
ncbi:MAG: hypothetical protein DRN08_07425 [Thermoplasmata archaeon]|nr:MAG: hypothetical protein DRN08_07425 [Thermoplasmata archaeon]